MKYIRLIEAFSYVVPKPDGDKPSGPLATWPREWQAWENDRVDYVDLIALVNRMPKACQGGVPLEDQRRGIRVLDAIEDKSLGDVLALEDADWEYLTAKVKAFPYPVVDRRIVRFIDAFIDAPSEPVDENGLIHVSGTFTSEPFTLPEVATNGTAVTKRKRAR